MAGLACASCGAPNESDARFCEGCGSLLDRSCETCGAPANATARFCRACGAPLNDRAGPAPESPTRKTVTVLFADLAGSTSFEEQVDAETTREVIGQYHDLLRSTADRHRAGVTKYIGDGFMAVWGVPEVGADDAGHAVDAAVELQERFVDLAARVADAHGVDLALRVAVNTGEVVVGAGDADLVGDALNVGARLESECPHGHVVVGEETWRSTRGRHRYEPLGQVHVKGRATPVAVYQWLGGRSETADTVAFVGRADEFQRLRKVFDDAVAARAVRLVTVLGEPGVGKSRLAAEFAGAQPGGRVIQAYCVAEGTVALAPIVEVLRTRDLDADVPAGVPERDRILRDLSGLTAGLAGSVEENFWALRHFVEVLASEGPLILVLDDIQWADTLLLDFVEHLAEWLRDVPVLILALARPELREVRPDLFTAGGWVSDALRLRGLGPDATAELAARVLGSDRLPAELLGRLPSSTGGNPLFVRELVGMLAHDGVLVAKPEGWRLTIDVDAIAVPPTIQALLASRLERMNTADRRVLEIASVIGTDFSPDVVCALGRTGAAEVKNSLDRLRRRELAQPSGAYIGDEPVWRFHHVLIRDVAYRRLLKSDRADLHERLADWVQAGGANGAFESDELVARNLEAAHGYRCDLGARDAGTHELALRSARSYLASARRALDRDELVSAGTQAARGAALASADHDLHADLLLVGCEAFLSAGDVAAAAPLVDDLERIADDALVPWATCYRCQFIVYTDPTRLPEVDARLHDPIEEFGRRRDAAGLAKAHRVRAGARGRLGRIGDCEVDLFEALIAARQGGDHRQITAALGAAPNAALWGPSPVPKAGGRCLDVVRMQRMTTAAPSLEATSLRCLAVLELLRGRPDKARSMLADARQIVADLGLRHGLMETELFAGIIELMVGDPVAAEPHFRTALEGLDALGAGADAGQAAALLARSVLAQGRIDEADRYAAESERIAGHNLKTAIAWRAVRAEILSAQGRHDEAVALARDAVAVAACTDLVLDHADACLALSRVLAAADDERAAANARRDAESLYAAKDAVITTRRATESAVAHTAAPPPDPSKTSRLTTVNRASEILEPVLRGIQPSYSDSFVYDDRRRLSGEPIIGGDKFQAARVRKLEQYPHAEGRTLAVRGETLILIALHWSDDTGNETTSLDLFEVDGDALLSYHGRFDEDDFESAYRELERRYYAGEGAPFAENGRKVSAWLDAMWRHDVEAARRVARPDFRWLAPASALKPVERSVDQFFQWMDERAQQLSSLRPWLATMRWLSPNCYVALNEVRGTGSDGEEYRWNRIYVSQYRDGLAASVREFDVEDEDQAFAYAQTLVAPRASRLAVSNRASEILEAGWRAMKAGDADGVVAAFSDGYVLDDRRRWSGDPIADSDGLRTATQRHNAQYPHVEWRTLAVRGETLALSWARFSDDAGNETTSLDIVEVGGDGLASYFGRFDEDDFEDAYRELELRYYAGEGAPFANSGMQSFAVAVAMNRGDFDAMFNELSQPDIRFQNRSHSVFPDRSAAELRASFEELYSMVSSVQSRFSAVRWMSPTLMVGRLDREAVGRDGEQYTWTRILVNQFRDGLLASTCEFEHDDEDQAFAYAQTLVAPRPSRLAVSNSAREVGYGVIAAAQARDIDAAVAAYSDQFVYDDRRRLSGDPIVDLAGVRAAHERLWGQYSRFEVRTLAIRGERLHLAHYRWSDDAGNQSSGLGLNEIGDDGRIIHETRFDEDDFEGAYAELEHRYYAGEGALYAISGRAATDWVAAIGRRDVEAARRVSQPDFRWSAPPSALKAGERSIDDIFQWMQERGRQVSSQRHSVLVQRWLSPNIAVGLGEVSAVGHDGEEFEWNLAFVAQCRDGLLASIKEFDAEDEDAAFAYAEKLVAQQASRMVVKNAASQALDRLITAMLAHDVDTAVRLYSERFIYGDRRGLSGAPIIDHAQARAAARRILSQYNHFQGGTLAVRGECLQLSWSRWSDDAGNETAHLHVVEVDDDGRIEFDGRFDEDDFEGAYRELEHRYYAGEGADFVEAGTPLTDVIIAVNRGELDRAFGEILVPGIHIESRSHSIFPSRTAAEVVDSVGELGGMVASLRAWFSAVCWVSPNWVIARHEREAVGRDGERYAWVRLYVAELRAALVASVCEFDVEDEEQAFTYAEERMRASASRLAVTNRASEVGDGVIRALRARDVDAAVGAYSDQAEYDDRRRWWSGDPIRDRAGMRAAFEHICAQYSRFDGRMLAVRGERLYLAHYHWSDDAGNQTSGLALAEIGDYGRITYDGRFDEDDFESAYRELEQRYYAGEGLEFAANGRKMTSFLEAMDALDVEAARGVCLPAFRWFTPPSTLTAQERSLDEFFTWVQERAGQVSSVKNFGSVIRWLSPTCFIALGDVRATGADGEQYGWARLYVGEFRGGLFASMRQFEDEEAAFAYAQERMRTAGSRPAVANRASDSVEGLIRAIELRDFDAALEYYSDHYVFDDRRPLSGERIRGKAAMRAAIERIIQQFNRFEMRVLAARGERLTLWWSRWSDDAGNESAHLHVFEIGDDGRITRDCRFDQKDFEGAYQELEQRYYAGEGAPFAESGSLAAEYVFALNRGDFDRIFSELSSPDSRVENRSRSGLPDRSAAELRASLEELETMFASVRAWFSKVRWLSPSLFVGRIDREALGRDGERYVWARVLVVTLSGRIDLIYDFDADDEAAAFAYAEERVRETGHG
ncbi:MAG: tetratricopeptide repeat protein [Mycobacteriaceae bacterium]